LWRIEWFAASVVTTSGDQRIDPKAEFVGSVAAMRLQISTGSGQGVTSDGYNAFEVDAL